MRPSIVPVAGEPVPEPITVDELQAIARIVAGDEELALCPGYIQAAREQVERDTDLRLVARQYIATYDAYAVTWPLPLPYPPLVSVEQVAWTDGAGLQTVVPPSEYLVDVGRVPGYLLWNPSWQPRPLRALAVTFTSGYVPTALPGLLKFAVGVLAAHYLTTGRDAVTTLGSLVVMPHGYQEAIDRSRLVTL
jgi:uncharacterized phiE125 gp8 family phage protein